jgi:hypothetical protein
MYIEVCPDTAHNSTDRWGFWYAVTEVVVQRPIKNRTLVGQQKISVYNLETWKVMCFMVLRLSKLGGKYLLPVHVVFLYCMNKIFISGNRKKINQQYTL